MVKTLLLFFLFSTHVIAETAPCQPLLLSTDPLVLTTQKPIQIFFHNISAHPVFVSHPLRPVWSQRIDADKWSVLLLTAKRLTVTCVESLPGHEQVVPCQQVLTACKRPSTESSVTTTTRWIS